MEIGGIEYDFDEHPKVWKRRLMQTKKGLSKNSPYLIKLLKAYKDWQREGGKITEKQQQAVHHLYACWIEADIEISRINEYKFEKTKWKLASFIAVIALFTSISSVFVSAHYQQKNYKINEKRLEYTINKDKKVNVSLETAETHNKAISADAKNGAAD